ncbi:transcriptional regulator, ArsR family [Methanoregula boonei 6A8]|uniref:Transcriptional regulator, ArsR family n=1 Tax=Methanoregula boonei (strain DSM 21154 / JCM 14090 / 6A8) TaxID=456442 RepID=A7I5I9_METB6|nr:NAD(P)H-dependent oxidoreductase [Methanoregula boonei]ABS55000.1 transcriptional regulator, ArsR family [Methanoregula boonei 6A8]
MRICIIYHSETGNTRHVAQHIASVIPDSRLVEVTDRAQHMALTRFLAQCKDARGENKTEIEPSHLNVREYDLLVFGSPVWAFKPTPAIHSIIDVLENCEKKRAVAFVTCGGRPGGSREVFKKWIEARGMNFAGFTSVNEKDIEDAAANAELITLVKSAVPKLD